ncbi:MAG: hypothetical protein JJ895_00585 [Balneolaceae bacterium]|nr:hypothetical protein [Balneolaceae bacterium]
MFKFFRRIRQNLLSDNKITKYLIYSIGEIVLVVIGILIALQVNNWNEDRKELVIEQQILKQLKVEYQNNLDQLNEKIQMRNEALEASNILLSYIDDPETLDEPTFYYSLVMIIRDPTFDPIKNDIIGTEKLRNIRNDTLVQYLSNWSSEVFQVQELELVYSKYRTEIIYPKYNQLGITRNMFHSLWKDGFSPTEALDKETKTVYSIKSSKKELSFDTILKDVELEGIISQVITFHLLTNRQSETLRDRIYSIQALLDREIDQ